MTYKLVKAGDKMSLYDKANETANYLKSKIKNIPDTAIVLGSGLGMFANEIEKELYSTIKIFRIFPYPPYRAITESLYSAKSEKRK